MDEIHAIMANSGYHINKDDPIKSVFHGYALYLLQKKENGEALTRNESKYLSFTYGLLKLMEQNAQNATES